MAEYRGIYPARDLVPCEFGLFSAARVVTDKTDKADQPWIRGFSYEYDSRPTLRILKANGAQAVLLNDGAGLQRSRYISPFFIEIEDYHSTFDITGEDRYARVLKQLEAATQKAVEYELANGAYAQTVATTSGMVTHDAAIGANQYLADVSSLVYADSLTPGTKVSALRAIELLEHRLSTSPAGEQGIMHLSRDIASSLGANYLLMRVEDDPGHFHVETINGTTTSIGAGYKGDGPVLSVANKALTANVATITVSTNHVLSVGETVVVSIGDATFDGTQTVTAVSSSSPWTFSYAKTATNVTSAAATGTAQMQGTQSTKWIYATGNVDVRLGVSEVVNDNIAQGYDSAGNKNDMRIKAQRPAAVYFDPAMHYAVKVDLTA
jgi:hypothetical protein